MVGVRIPVLMRRDEIAVERSVDPVIGLVLPRMLEAESAEVPQAAVVRGHVVDLALHLDPAMLERLQLAIVPPAHAPSFNVDDVPLADAKAVELLLRGPPTRVREPFHSSRLRTPRQLPRTPTRRSRGQGPPGPRGGGRSRSRPGCT